MSLHIEITEEARIELNRQKKRDTLGSFGIAFLSMAGLGLGFWAMKIALVDMGRPNVIAYTPPAGSGDEPIQKEINRPNTPTSSAAPPTTKVIATTTLTNISITPPDVVVTDPTLGMSQGLELGTGFGGLGSGPGGDGIPKIIQKRCSPEDRLARLKEMGGTPECDTAVTKGLEWLKANQNSDGSWGDEYKVGVTGLVLLAYLGHCETPVSENFGDSCLRAIAYLQNIAAKNNGRMATNFNNKHWPYEHSIATYALSEAYTFCNVLGTPAAKDLNTSLKAAVQYIIDNQCPTGGWEYSYEASATRGGDLSIAGWHIQALKAASHTGIQFKDLDKSMRLASKYVKDCYFEVAPGKGSFAYTKGGNTAPGGKYTLCGTGALNLQMLGDSNSREVRGALKSISDDVIFDWKTPEGADLYMHYYMAQAAMNRGGEVWAKYNPSMKDQLLANQGADGLWSAPQKPALSIHRYVSDTTEGKAYRNALSCLMLEVYYRFLPGTGHTR